MAMTTTIEAAPTLKKLLYNMRGIPISVRPIAGIYHVRFRDNGMARYLTYDANGQFMDELHGE